MEKYLQAVLEQIRCKKVHPYIREELMGHIQDQIEDNRKSGMSEKEAEEAAVRDMGDPVEIGVRLRACERCGGAVSVRTTGGRKMPPLRRSGYREQDRLFL